MEEIIIDKIEWFAPEYKHEEKSIDFLWAIGLVALVVCGLAIWFQNYLFAVFIIISGASLILFSIRHPQEIQYAIETSGISLGKDKYPWKEIKGFHIKKEEDYAVLLIELNKYLLPVYTIPLPIDQIPIIKESLLKIIPNIELEESRSMKFMEKLGF
ncbi:MAG: hypothetical protein UR85_C0002G0017 [Candidatus Nomurabacteria bacterium GW2011_GWF2_35_66]|uniref:DUF5673 domain-containing protein n=1 Tax=Candidatus Nomurabacteria bacterium GW2011_GWE1_35_16 TaxID=1618761 RepID=A0A0G0BAN6_9BACT|nr:MAG: hypothetical protein UR55_C0007G0025 [Candidatus Nomurabacteria bacterium GW2011_GWF1_34_20]KKP63300.1 MAG: hypothetical protein UR57_C0006G0025 [Candidatus Nomurabacteria bacterium GW2011_GWE2_34_25]KKP66498.1 MAG: hypothetical protein UR64_C0006G0025 [Candidatus Nomurabacteria bacterium GW2011_GWE1_35_16]KKP83704.1 MAG: hypothetical protein UR85_C0002G0017 [Candidatus Nomurabacteria bacterium GW2011_GWF2_35_66]HAE36934.1 hypothetical protein [Candidatus Nomurabacteria bacterium]